MVNNEYKTYWKADEQLFYSDWQLVKLLLLCNKQVVTIF